MEVVLTRPVTSPADKRDAPNSSPHQEKERDQQPSEWPILGENDKSQEASGHVPLVSETIRPQALLLTIAALLFAAGSRNKTYLSDRTPSTYSEGASRPRTRRSQVHLSSSSTCRTLSTSMGVVRVQAHRWPEARAGQPCFEGSWCAPEKRERWSSGSPRQAAFLAVLFRTGIGIIPEEAG
jgi:hypothetical protein